MQKTWRYLGITAAAFVSFALSLLLILFLLLVIFNHIDQTRFRSTIEEQVTKLTGRQLTLSGDLHLELSLKPSLSLEKASFANAAWSDRAQMLSIDKLYVKVNLLSLLKKQLAVEQLLLDGVEISVENNAEAQLNWKLEKFANSEDEAAINDNETTAQSEPFTLPFLPVLKHVTFNAVQLHYHDAIETIDTDAGIDTLLLTNPGIDQPINFSAQGTVNKQTFDISGESRFLSELTIDNISDQGIGIKLNADALGVKLVTEGKIENPGVAKGIDIAIQLHADDMDKTFTAATGQTIKKYVRYSGKTFPLSFSANFKDITNGYALNGIKLKLSDSDLNGDLSYIAGDERLQIIADLDAQKLDLDQLRTNSTSKTAGKKSSREKPHTGKQVKASGLQLPDTALPFDLLKTLDADISLVIGELQYQVLHPTSIKVRASIQDGLLKAKQIDLKLDDGSIRSSMMIDGRSKSARISTKLHADNLQLKSIARLLQLESIRSGVLQTSLDLKTRGDSVRAIVTQLKGTADIQLTNAVLSQHFEDKEHTATIEHSSLQYRGNNKAIDYSLDGKIDGEPLLLSGKLTSLSSIINNQPLDLTASLDALKLKIDVNGNIEKPLDADQAKLTVALDIPEPKTTVRKLIRFIPTIKQNKHLAGVPITVHTELTASAKHYKLDGLRIKAGNSDLSGSILADTSRNKPYIDARLESQLIDLNQLLPETILEEDQPNNAKAKSDSGVTSTADNKADNDGKENNENRKLFSSNPLPAFDALNKVDMDVRYTLKKLTSNKQVIDNITLDMKIKDSRLTLDRLSIDFSGGTISSQLIMSSVGTPSFELNTKITKLDYDRLMKILGTKEYARGEMDAEINLGAKGDSLSALMAHLNGRVRATTVNGELNSQALKLLSKDIVSLIPFTDTSNRQKIKCGVVQFDIKQGLAATHSMVINTGAISALGTGDINLANESLDLYVAPRTKRTSVINVALVPVNITGPLSSPSIIPDLAGSTISTTKTATNIGLTIATSGIWLLAQGFTNDLWDKFVDDTDYCAKALAGDKIVPSRIALVKEGEDISEQADEEDEDDDLFDDDGGW